MLLVHPNCEVINVSERDFRTFKTHRTVTSLNTLLDWCPCPHMINQQPIFQFMFIILFVICYLNHRQRAKGRKAEGHEEEQRDSDELQIWKA